MSKTIKISDENYRLLCKIAGKSQMEMMKPISLDDAINYLKKKANVKDEK